LTSERYERTEVADKYLGDVVHKFDNTILLEIIPILQDSLYRRDVFTKKKCLSYLRQLKNTLIHF